MARKKSAPHEGLVVHPVTRANWPDFVRLFESKGAPHFCWCTSYRLSNAKGLADAEKKSSLNGLVSKRMPIGVLAFAGRDPLGWCSIAPRETYLRLEKSRTMPRATPATTPTWSVLCFFVLRSHRKQGVAQKLLEGAVAYARSHGAEVIEGYPFDTGGSPRRIAATPRSSPRRASSELESAGR